MDNYQITADGHQFLIDAEDWNTVTHNVFNFLNKTEIDFRSCAWSTTSERVFTFISSWIQYICCL